MQIELARDIAKAVFRSTRPLGDLILTLKAALPEAEYRPYAKALAHCIAQTQIEVLNKVIAEHPVLEGEIEAAIKKEGQYG